MADLYLIGDTIRFTASIVDLEEEVTDPEVVTISVFTESGEE